jgi:hypothetical protein
VRQSGGIEEVAADGGFLQPRIPVLGMISSFLSELLALASRKIPTERQGGVRDFCAIPFGSISSKRKVPPRGRDDRLSWVEIAGSV